MPVIRTRADIDDLLGGPTEAEERLLAATLAGEECALGVEVPPETDTPDPSVHIRADVLRYLITGGCDVHSTADRGVDLHGAHITGTLDLTLAKAHGINGLADCRIDNRIQAAQAHFDLLSLNGSTFPGLNAQGAQIKGSVYLRNTKTKATVYLNSATIEGQLSCTGAELLATEGPALNAQRAKIKGSVFLHEITATAAVDLAGATIGGQLACVGAYLQPAEGRALNAHSAQIKGGVYLHPTVESEQEKVKRPFYAKGGINLANSEIGGLYAEHVTIEASNGEKALLARNLTVTGDVGLGTSKIKGEVLLAGAQITGELNCNKATFNNAEGHAFNGQRMRVSQAMVWKGVENTQGAVSLNGAHVFELDDKPEDWPGKERLLLDGFTYDRIRGKVSTSPARMDWLRHGSIYDGQFFPQPYSQYAKFLRDTGHDTQARRVLLERERLVRQYERREMSLPQRAWRYIWDGLQLVVVGHGHQPFWSMGWLALLIVLTIVPAHFAWKEGSFAPNAAPVLVSADWKNLEQTEEKPALVWSGETPPKDWEKPRKDAEWKDSAQGRDWETFNRYAYAADVVIPIIDFGQTSAWAPSTTRGPWGEFLWWWRWVATTFGWIVTALGAAAITGIIRQE